MLEWTYGPDGLAMEGSLGQIEAVGDGKLRIPHSTILGMNFEHESLCDVRNSTRGEHMRSRQPVVQMGSEAPSLSGESIILRWRKPNDGIFHLLVVLRSVSACKRGKTFSSSYCLFLTAIFENVRVPGGYSQTCKFSDHRDIVRYGLEIKDFRHKRLTRSKTRK